MRDILVKGLAQLGLSDHAVPQLEAYTSLLLEKNKVMNLTAITAPQEVATLHLLDCAALLTMADLRGKRTMMSAPAQASPAWCCGSWSRTST